MDMMSAAALHVEACGHSSWELVFLVPIGLGVVWLATKARTWLLDQRDDLAAPGEDVRR